MIKIGLFGYGYVGGSVVDILEKKRAAFQENCGEDIVVKHICVRNVEKAQKKAPSHISVSNNPDDILNDPEIDIVIEVMGGETPALDYIKTALSNKKHVITANKEVVAKHLDDLISLASNNQSTLLYEAAVAGGIPLIRSLKSGFVANKINSLSGILNGTTNYILSQIEEKEEEFESILKTAQDLGLAEADPHMDVSGLDAAYKLVILAHVAFKKRIKIDDIYYEGIEKISLTDIKLAKELGYRIKLLAIASESESIFKVHPTLLPLTHPLAQVTNEFNAVFIDGDEVGEAMLSGKGAGPSPTGSAVVSDVIDLAYDSQHASKRNQDTLSPACTPCPIENTHSQFYLRFSLKDEVGTLEKVSHILGAHSINIEKMKQIQNPNGTASLIILTHKAKESSIQSAINEIDALEESTETGTRIRLGL